MRRFGTWHVYLIAIVILLFFTRFVGLAWGLPFPFHPDERNMADAVMRLRCTLSEIHSLRDLEWCMNPEFFAYGQAPLYVGFILISLFRIVGGIDASLPISFTEAVMSLRVQSAILSVILTYMMWRIFALLYQQVRRTRPPMIVAAPVLALFTFQPYLIQFAHFGTTETVLMLIYTTLVYCALRMIDTSSVRLALISGALIGVGIGTKVSALSFFAVPAAAILYTSIRRSSGRKYVVVTRAMLQLTALVVTGLLGAIITSPHNLISLRYFIGSMNYEVGVANGSVSVDYTRQFIDTVPYIFQFTHIFPFVLGVGTLVLALYGFTQSKTPNVHILRFSWLVYFLPSGMLFAKWARFMAPIMPLMTIFAAWGLAYMWVWLQRFSSRVAHGIFIVVSVAAVLPGVAYTSIYMREDVRFRASREIARLVPDQGRVLDEGGNSVNLPVLPPGDETSLPPYVYRVQNLYTLDDPGARADTLAGLDTADIVIVPSRRIFANFTCYRPLDYALSFLDLLSMKDCTKLSTLYKGQHEYYESLLSTNGRFLHARTLTSYPRIRLFGVTLFEFPDETAEETWTVFDHPVVRVYKPLP